MSAETAQEYARRHWAELRREYVAKNPPSTNGKHPTLTFGADTRLPDSFWDDTPGVLGERLRHIRQAALARRVAPTAVFGAVLARISAAVHHSLRLPALIAYDSPLSMFVLVVGPPGSGKGGAPAVAIELLPNCPLLDAAVDGMPIGSGQGLIEVMWGEEPDPNDDKKKKMRRARIRHNCFVIVDEGEAIKGLESNTGSILLSTLCTVWSGGGAGQMNATKELTRTLDPASYTYGGVVGVQPENAALILSKDTLGTPQRFLFLPAIDPTHPDTKPAWPGPLHWGPPEHHDIAHLEHDRTNRGWDRRYLEIDPAVAAEVDAQHLAHTRGQRELARMDEHRTLLRLRVAGLLALLGGTYTVTEELWALAEVVVGVSCAARDVVVAITHHEAQRTIEAQGFAEGKREIARRRVVEHDEHEHLARRIVTKVRSGITARRDVKKSLAVAADPFTKALAYAVEHDWIVEGEEPSAQPSGQPRPSLLLGKKAPTEVGKNGG